MYRNLCCSWNYMELHGITIPRVDNDELREKIERERGL